MRFLLPCAMTPTSRGPDRRCARMCGRRGMRLLMVAAAAVVLLLLYSQLTRLSPTETALRHAAAFQRQYSWLHSLSLRDFIHPTQNTTLLAPRCATNADPAPLIVAVVTSAPTHVAARDAIRATWGGNRPEMKTVFLVGRPGDEETQAALVAESAEHRDVIQESFIERYQNLTIKSVFMLKWLTNSGCFPGAKFALKIDDDIWLDFPALVSTLSECTQPDNTCANDAAVALGRMYSGVTAYRDTTSKYYLPPRLFAEDKLPDFLSGTAYVLTTPAVDRLYRTALDTPFVNLEDLYMTGLVAPRAGVQLKHVKGFRESHPVWVHPCTCRGEVTVHGVSAEQMRRLGAAEGEECGVMWGLLNRMMLWVV